MSLASEVERPSVWDPQQTADVLEAARTEDGTRLMDLVESSPVLMVFLRHAGCTFCREAIADIAKVREEIESTGTRIVLVHMGDRKSMEALVERHGLSGLDRICDSSQELYRTFGLKKGTWRQLFGLKVWSRGFMAGVIRGNGIGRPSADPKQMPGVFFLDQGLIARAFRHRSAGDRPCYTDLCRDQEVN